MYDNIYGLSCVENQVLAILKTRGQDISPLYHNCAIPIRKLFIVMILLEQKPECFLEVPRVQDTLKRLGIISLKRKRENHMAVVRNRIQNCKPNEYILLRTNPGFTKNVLHARGFRDDHYTLAKAIGYHFVILNDIPEKAVTLEAGELSNAYGGDYFDLHIERGLTAKDRESLWNSQIFKPEPDTDSHSSLTKLDDIPDVRIKLRNMAGIYKTLRYQMAEYYGNYVDTGFIRDALPAIEQYYAMFEYYNLKCGTPADKYFGLLARFIQTDQEILSELIRRLAAVQVESLKVENNHEGK